VSGPDFVRFGGNTTCFAVVVDGLTVAFIDAGTGLAAYHSYGLSLAPSVSIFLTHYHWDHIQGLSMLEELWSGTCDVRVWGPDEPAAVLERAIAPPLFPVSISDAESISFNPMPASVVVAGVSFTSIPVHHPQGALGYRIDGPHRSIGIITDHESGSDLDDEIARRIAGVDVLIHDAQYEPSERTAHVGWGHSTYEDAVALASRVGASELVLTSHDPSRTDGDIDEMVRHVRTVFEASSASVQGLQVEL
jgi:ribonuclease BN (tRNA processing enzyme)